MHHYLETVDIEFLLKQLSYISSKYYNILILEKAFTVYPVTSVNLRRYIRIFYSA